MNPAPPASLRFRPMTEADLETVVRIERAAYPYPWTRGHFLDCLQAGYNCWVGERRGELAAYWLMMLALDEGHILNCCVAPHHQGRGLGKQLMAHLFEIARGHRTHTLFLEVRQSNRAAQGLYAGLGFEAVARRRAYYPSDDGREDALVMRRCM